MNQKPKAPSTIWIFPESSDQTLAFEKVLVQTHHFNPTIAKILTARGFDTIEKVQSLLFGKLENLYDPYLLKDMGLAVDRIYKAIKNNERILIYGDNDVDGMTGTALLSDFFRDLGILHTYFVPKSHTLKQSLVLDAIGFAKASDCKLIITVDCGITALDEMNKASSENIDVIVTDHHEQTASLPKCVATLNPKLQDSEYPNKDLTGVGVAFKLVHALHDFLKEKEEHQKIVKEIELEKYLDLVALGTVADMGSLIGENRILVREGLKQIKIQQRVGLQKLIEVCSVDPRKISPAEISSKIAPRLNSLGRVGKPQAGVDLLLLQNQTEAELLAKDLDLNNTKRQELERIDSERIDKYLLQNPVTDKAIVIALEDLHLGIIPIITARIAKQYNRPTLIIAIEPGADGERLGKGSMRTISKFPLIPILKQNRDLLITFGGHIFAAGMTIKESNIDLFKKRFIEAANAILEEEDLNSKIYIDAEVDLNEMNLAFLEKILPDLEPFGASENPPPIFYAKVQQQSMPSTFGRAPTHQGRGKTHLTFYVSQNGKSLKTIGFGMGDRQSEVYVVKQSRNPQSEKPRTLEIAFTPQISHYSGNSHYSGAPEVQLLLRDFRVVSS